MARALALLIDFVYTSEIQVTEDNVQVYQNKEKWPKFC